MVLLRLLRNAAWLVIGIDTGHLAAQSLGNAGAIRGVVTDATSAPLVAALVEVSCPGSGFARKARTGGDGAFRIDGLPPNSYELRISFPGFQKHRTGIAVRTNVPLDVNVRLELAGQRTAITVEGTADAVLEKKSIASEIIDRQMLDALPAHSPDSGLNDAILYTTPGVAADSNGFFHPLGDHAQVSYVIDGQPISDQRNKVFSTSIPANAIQSMEIISGSPAAEYGDKTSLIVNAITRSGLGQKPTGSFLVNYGSFGAIGEDATLALGGASWGNFIAFNAERTGRFLDTAEFWPMHAAGNTGTFFDRIDFIRGGRDIFHLDLMAARNWLQVPNNYDQPRQDQRQKVVSFNIAPGYQRTLGSRTLLSAGAFIRRDQVNYYPTGNPFDDSPATLAQDRSLTNFGMHADLVHGQGRHNWKAGIHGMQTRLREFFQLGITDPSYNAPPPNPDFLPGLLAYDLTRGGRLFQFQGSAKIRQLAFFGQDTIALGALTLTAGVRFDQYDGLTHGGGAQPRGGFSYLFRRTKTVLRGGYSHTLETPINENLVASSSTGSGGLASNLLKGTAVQQPIALGSRNQYDAGLQQALGKWVTLDISYFRKYTRNAYDFDALFSTPITFPIGWKQSKLDGVSARISIPDIHGFRAYATMGHANARFFGPENGGIVFNSNLSVGAYRQDHDQVYQHNLNLQYRRKTDGWWADFTWRYDSGLVVGAVNNLADALDLTADQQSMIGLHCGDQRASVTHRIVSCASSDYGAERIHILAPGAANSDRNPPRAKSRNIFDLGAGSDNLLRTERMRTVVRFTVLNLSNQASLYNFLSPFGGTHWAAPRTYRAQVGWTF